MMKPGIFLAIFLILVMIACKKDKFTTEPQVTVKSISPGSVSQGNLIKMKAKFTDDEGDLDSIFIVYKWYNGTIVTRKDTFRTSTAAFNLPAQTRQGDILVNFLYGISGGDYPQLPSSPVSKDTTSTLGLVLKDKAGHRSGYSESDPIRLKKN